MNWMRRATGLALALMLVGVTLPTDARAQSAESGRPRRSMQNFDRAYQIGFDKGYGKGYELGVKDSRSGDRHDVTNTKNYNRADDYYNNGIGNRNDFRQGFQAGFEKGYDDALMGRQYGARPGDSRVPVSQPTDEGPVLKRGDDAGAQPDPGDATTGDPNASDPNTAPVVDPAAYDPANRRVGYDTSLVVELETPVTTRYSKAGDRFSARVLDPQTFAGARVEGYLSKVQAPGRTSGKGEVTMTFQRIVFPDGYAEPLDAQVEKVIGYPSGTPTASKKGPLSRPPWEWGRKQDRNDEVDATAGDEGQIEGESSRNRDIGTIGGGAAAGAILGSILGGGSGAAIGAAIGAAAGGGVVATSKGHHIDLEPGAQLAIRTGRPARS